MNFLKTKNVVFTFVLLAVQQAIIGSNAVRIINMPITVTYSSTKTPIGQPKMSRVQILVDVEHDTGKDLIDVLRNQLAIPDEGIVLSWSEPGKVGAVDVYEKVGERALRALKEKTEEEMGLRHQNTTATFIANIGIVLKQFSVSLLDAITWNIKPLFISFDAKRDTIKDIINRMKAEGYASSAVDLNIYNDHDDSITQVLTQDAQASVIEKGQKPAFVLKNKLKPLDLNMKAADAQGMMLYAQ